PEAQGQDRHKGANLASSFALRSGASVICPFAATTWPYRLPTPPRRCIPPPRDEGQRGRKSRTAAVDVIGRQPLFSPSVRASRGVGRAARRRGVSSRGCQTGACPASRAGACGNITTCLSPAIQIAGSLPTRVHRVLVLAPAIFFSRRLWLLSSLRSTGSPSWRKTRETIPSRA